ncbi:MAG TPA: Txe/YoeB family addiction module toxin [Selenomonas sp.]|nr:Txe/YoeB family addiction module toxin [Selenomonadaceae bacterium]HCB93283.1 Txe/YoeB family addiction module toxin [Selenomonas sp.]
MGTLFDDEAFEQLIYWMKENRKNADKIHDLIKDIRRNGLAKGTGKPEPLKYRKGWIRRIDHANRLVYDMDSNGNIRIISCKGHYED